MSQSYGPSLAALRTRLERLLLTTAASGSANYDHWTATVKRDLLNEAQQDIQMELLESYQTQYFTLPEDLSAVAGEINLEALSRPVLRLVAIFKQSNTDWLGEPYVRIVSVAEGWKLSGNQFERWFPIGKKLKNRDETLAGTYRIVYHYRLRPLEEDGDETEIPEEYQELLVYRAAQIGSAQAHENEQAQVFGVEYQQRLIRMRQTAAKRNQVQRLKITESENYGDNWSGYQNTVFLP